MYRTVQLALGGLLAVVFGLSALSRRFPHVAWLRSFRYNTPRLSEEQQARIRHRANIHAGIELILLGIVLPLIYIGGSVMFFNSITPLETALVLVGSLVLITLGATAIWRDRRK
jgi:hypothetical protein